MAQSTVGLYVSLGFEMSKTRAQKSTFRSKFRRSRMVQSIRLDNVVGIEFIDENDGGPDVRLRRRQLAKQPHIRANAVGTKVPAPCLYAVL